ncbi:MAG: DNA translocase FtsK 4TM domain-containing protein, partial [Actinomycetota bacterium]
MATKTSPSRRSSSRASSRSSSKRKPTATRRAASKKSAPKKPERTPTRQILSPHARDAAGIGLVVLALLAVLGVWLESAGPVGRGLSWLLHGTYGVGAMLFPIVGVYWGIVLLRDVAPEDRVRMFIGFFVLTVGALGIVSLARGNPSPFAGYDATKKLNGLSEAGGLAGAIAAYPMSRVISDIGAGIVCTGLAVIGLLIFTGTPVSAVRDKLRELRVPLDEPQTAQVLVPDAEPEKEHKLKRRSRMKEALGLGDEPPAEPIVVLPDTDAIEPITDEAPLKVKKASKPQMVTTSQGPYQLPPLDLLRTAPPSTADGSHEIEVTRALGHTLLTFGVDAKVVAAHRGPTVTMYEVEVASGTKVNKVLNLSSDIAYALATPDVRIQAPIPGRSAIGIEVPNKHRDFVMLGDILRSDNARAETHPLTVALGKDIHGRS